MTKAKTTANPFDQEYRVMALDDLIELPDNPRRGDLALLQESMDELGFYGAVIVDRDTMEVLAGNHRMKAAREQGLDSVPCILVDGSDQRGRKIALVDNHANDRATYDVHSLALHLQKLDGDFVGTGYTENDLADLLAQVTAPDLPGSGNDDGGGGGTGDDKTYWPTIKLQVPPAVYAAWGALSAKHDDEAQAFTWLMEQYAGESLTDDADVDEALSQLD